MKTKKEKHYIVKFERLYEISESQVKARITQFCNVGETADDHDQSTDEYQALVEQCTADIACDLMSEEMPEKGRVGYNRHSDIENFFDITHSPSVIIY